MSNTKLQVEYRGIGNTDVFMERYGSFSRIIVYELKRKPYQLSKAEVLSLLALRLPSYFLGTVDLELRYLSEVPVHLVLEGGVLGKKVPTRFERMLA